MSSTVTDQENEAGDMVDVVKTLTRKIAGRCDEIERARRVPADLVDELAEAGCFRMLVPRSHGGSELDLAAQMRVCEELSRADGSLGWTVMIAGTASALLGYLPRSTYDAVYATDPDIVVGGALNPTGVATPVDGGFRVTGRWSFASGCQSCDWFFAHTRVDDGRMPPVRMMVLPAADVTIEDTWFVSGLCGTGSHDFRTDDTFVPAQRSFVMGGEAGLDVPLLRVPVPSMAALECAAVAVGIAQGALDEVTALATEKVPAFDKTALAASPLFQHQLAEADAGLRAARALLYADVAGLWAAASDRAPIVPEQRARVRATATWATRTAASVVDTAYTAGGGTAIYTSSPLQRRLRDIHTVTQHFGVKADTLTKAGAVLAGQDVDLTSF